MHCESEGWRHDSRADDSKTLQLTNSIRYVSEIVLEKLAFV